jgi:hypothetical protein
VYCIVVNTVPYADTTANYNFTLDGIQSGTYHHAPDNSTTILYNTRVWSLENISNMQHTLVITPAATTSTPTLILFDYVEYT